MVVDCHLQISLIQISLIYFSVVVPLFGYYLLLFFERILFGLLPGHDYCGIVGYDT